MQQEPQEATPPECSRFGFAIATWFHIGLASRAGGTLAALTALPLHWALRPTHIAYEIVLIVAITVAGIWAGQHVAQSTGQHDPQIVVVDEVAGALIALALARDHGIGGDLVALGLFRLFDIFKPWPIMVFERLRHPGAAIMFDDIAAGLLAGTIVYCF